MISYKEMVRKAKAAGIATEKTMWDSIDSFSDLLDSLKDSHPDMYWAFMRKQHGIMYKNHYDEAFGNYAANQLRYSGKNGEKRTGPHWTVDQIESATTSMKFPAGTTRWDKFVAFNAAYADLSSVLSDEDVLKAGHALYFADEDWGGDTKIWDVMTSRPTRGQTDK